MKVIVKAYPASENDLHVLKGALKSVLLKAKAQGACECEQKDITLWAFQNSPSPFGGRFLDD